MAFVDNTTGGRVVKEGIMPVRITLTDTCDVGDLIGYEGITDNEWQRADANGKAPAQLVAGEPCRTSGDEIVCFKMAVVDFGSGSTATSGDMVYLSDTVGAYVATPDSWVSACVGQCVSATEAFINPSCTPIVSFSNTGTGWGAYIRAELESGRTATALWGGMRIDVKTIDTSTVGSDIYGLYIHYQLQQDTAGDYYILRLEENSSVDQTDAFIQFIANRASVPTNLFYLGPNAVGPCWTASGTTKSGSSSGYLTLTIAGATKYINLWDS